MLKIVNTIVSTIHTIKNQIFIIYKNIIILNSIKKNLYNN